jgi:hypothetical protein
MTKPQKSLNTELDELLAVIDLPSDSDLRKQTGNARQAEKIQGRKRKDQSARMSGHNNIMAGKTSPNRGKEMPQISEKIRGKSKPNGFGEKISKARTGVPNLKALGKERPEHSKTMKDPSRNKGAEYMRETITCPHCGKSANGPNYKRWHGDNCKHKI